MIIHDLLSGAIFRRAITGQTALNVTTVMWWQYAVMAGLQLWQGYKQGQAAEAGGDAAKWASYQNADDLMRYSGLNAELIHGAANRNASAYLTIGEANASAIERATERNLMLYGMQADEEVRRHVYGEKMIAGGIRAMPGAAGVQTNTGTPLRYLHAQVDEGLRQRTFMVAKHAQTMWTMSEEGKDRAYVTRLTASENAAVIMSNAEAQSAMAILDAERQAAAMRRSGDVAQQTGEAQASSALWSGISNAAMTGLSAWNAGAFGGSSSTGFQSAIANDWSSAGGWGNRTTFNTGFMNPYPSYGNALPAIQNPSGFSSALNPFPSYGT